MAASKASTALARRRHSIASYADEQAAIIDARELDWIASEDGETWTCDDNPHYEIVCTDRIKQGPLKGLRRWRANFRPTADANHVWIGDAPTLSLDVAFLLVEDHRWLAKEVV